MSKEFSKVIYIHIGLSSFVLKDIDILKKHFETEVLFFNHSPGYLLPFKLVGTFFQMLFKRKSLIVIQFGGFHCVPVILASKLRGHKVAIVLGGTDCVSFPSIQYGNFNKVFQGGATGFALRHANLLLPVDESLIYYDYTYQKNDYPAQGYQFHRPNVTTAVTTVYDGYESDKFHILEGVERKPNSFVTIGGGLGSRFGYELKGIDLIIDTAAALPTIDIYIIGGKGLEHKLKSDNVHLLPTYPNNELTQLLNQFEYYFQLSMSEGFPNALCEAMLCGCYPIVSNVGAMPKIVNGVGSVIQRKEVGLIVEAIQMLTVRSEEQRKADALAVSNRIKDTYPLSKREEGFIEALKTIH